MFVAVVCRGCHCFAGVHPRHRPALSAHPPFFLLCHPGLRAGILGGLMRGIALRCRLAIVILACAPQGSLTRQLGWFGNPLLSFPPPSGNPGWPYTGYYAAANRLAGIHPRQHPPGCRIKCGMTALVRRLCCHRGCAARGQKNGEHCRVLPVVVVAGRPRLAECGSELVFKRFAQLVHDGVDLLVGKRLLRVLEYEADGV